MAACVIDALLIALLLNGAQALDNGTKDVLAGHRDIFI